MLEVSEASNLIRREISPTLIKKTVPVSESLNRILADDIYAPFPIPAYRMSIKDGYAVKSSDGGKNRTVRNVVAAGDRVSQNEWVIKACRKNFIFF